MDLWDQLLSSATTAGTSQLPSSTLLIVGNEKCGKKTLLSSFQQRFQDRRGNLSFDLPEEHQLNQNYHQHHTTDGSLLKYSFLPAVHPDDADADIDTAPTCDVWTLSKPNRASFLDFALRSDTLSHLAVVIVLDFQRPSSMVASLETWLKTVVGEIKPRLDKHPDRATIVQTLTDHVRLYRLHHTGKNTTASAPQQGSEDGAASAAETMANVDIDLSEGVLTNNCGVPIIVCCNKSDAIVDVGKASSASSIPVHVADHLQKKIREVCLAYGAALMYVSSTKQLHTDTLHRYLLYRLYPTQFTFEDSAEVVDSKSIFVPSGWDSAALVQDMEIDDGLTLSNFGKPPVGESVERGKLVVVVAAAVVVVPLLLRLLLLLL